MLPFNGDAIEQNHPHLFKVIYIKEVERKGKRQKVDQDADRSKPFSPFSLFCHLSLSLSS